MKLPKQQQKEIIDGMLLMLRPAVEKTERVRRLKGSTLKNFMNITHLQNGKPVMDSGDYTLRDVVETPVNHSRRLKAIIELSQSQEQMTEAMGEYLAKYAKSKEDVLAQIPEHLKK